MYLLKRCCDRTLEETAELFGVRSYGTVGWASHGVQSKGEFRDRVERLFREFINKRPSKNVALGAQHRSGEQTKSRRIILYLVEQQRRTARLGIELN
jgi:hypothetical protein